jgi:hypothetical protein
MALSLHESLVKFAMVVLDEVEDDLKSLFSPLRNRHGRGDQNNPVDDDGEPSSPHLHGKTKYDVAYSHVFSLESFIIVALTAVVSILLSCRRRTRR